MIFLFDRKMEAVGALTEGNFFEDKLIEKLENSYLEFTFKVPLQVPQSKLIEEEGFVMTTDLDGRKQLFVITYTTTDHEVVSVEAEHIAVNDLNDALVLPVKLNSQHLRPVLEYILDPLSAEYEVGEVADDTETHDIEFESIITIREALLTVAELYNVEVFFETDLHNNVVGKTKVNALKQRGTKTNLTLDYGSDVSGIERTGTSSEVYTSVVPLGFEGLNLIGYTGTLEEGFTRTDRAVNNMVAFEQYARRGRHKQTYIETEDRDRATLYQSAVKFLKAHSKPKYDYSVSVVMLESLTGYSHKKIRLGDTLTVRDFETDKDNPLILQARVIELTSSKTNQEENQIVLGEYVRLGFKRSDSILSLQRKIRENEKTWNTVGESIEKSPTPPVDPQLNQLWIDTSTEPYVQKMWNGYDWVEAGSDLGDIENKIAQVEENTTPVNIIQTVVQSADVQTLLGGKANVEDLAGLATGEQLVATQEAIQQYTDNRIDYVGEQVNELSSSLTKTAQDVRVEFRSAGGINLIRNSIGWANIKSAVDYWTVSGLSIAKNAELESMGYGAGWVGGGTATQTVQLVPNIPYTLSFLLRKMSEGAAYIEVSETVSGTKKNLLTIGKPNGTGTTEGLEFASGQFKPTQNVIEVKIIMSEASNSTLTALMLNEGTIPFAWNHHKEEVYGNNIIFNQNGMRVQSVDEEGNTGLNYTQITTGELAGYGREDVSAEYKKIFALNGETTLVQKIVVEEEFLMGPLKMRKMTTDTSTKNGWAILPNE